MKRDFGVNFRQTVALAAAACLLMVLWALTLSPAHASEGPNAVVGGLDGNGEIVRDTDSDPKELQKGDVVTPWDTVSTGKKSKLLLRWDNGLATSMGEYSSLMTAPDDTGAGTGTNIQVLEGIARVFYDPRSVDRSAPYSVGTPVVSVQPATTLEPVDFVLEVYSPTKTVLTVISGKVRVSSPRGDGWRDKIVNSCHTLYVEDDKQPGDSLPSTSEDLGRLVDDSSIAGTLKADPDSCEPRMAREPVRPAPPRPSPQYGYGSFPDYSVDYWDVDDIYPYTEIRVIRRWGNYCVVYIPGAGYFYIPIPTVSGWVYDPVYFEVCARYVFLRHAIAYDRHYLHDCHSRRRELYNMIYLAQRSGRTDLLINLRRELDYLNTRSHWASRRINGLEHRLGGLETEQRGFRDRLPRGLNLVNMVSDSFNSQQNVNVIQSFNNRVRTDLNLQDQLAGVAGREMSTLRNRIANERDPQKRLAMWDQAGHIRHEVGQGKAPIPPREKEVKDLLRKMENERDPGRQAKIQNEILGQLKKREGGLPVDMATQANLATLKKDITVVQNPHTKQLLETRLNDLERSFQVRNREEAERQRAEHLTEQLARETDPGKREDLLGKLKDVSKVVPLMALPAGMQLLQDRRKVEKQLTAEKDPAKRSTLDQTLQELKKKQEEFNQRQLVEVAKPPQQRLLEQQEHDRQTEDLRKQWEEQKKQADLQKQDRDKQPPKRLIEPQDRERLADPAQRQQEEQKRITDRQLREQQERQVDLRRKEQEEKQKQGEQRLREQQEKEQQTDLRKRETEDKQKQVEQRLREQQERDRQADIKKKEQEEKQKQVEQRLREQQEKEQQTDLRKRETEDKQKQVEQRLREQQERDRQADIKKKEQEEKQRQGEQRLREQQERERQTDLRKREAEEKQKQTEQRLKEQQERERQGEIKRREQEGRQQQLEQRQKEQQERERQMERDRRERERQSQEQLHRQQEQQRSQELRRQQEAERARQAEQARQQQERQQQQIQQQQQQERLRQEQQRQIQQQQQLQQQQAEKMRQEQIRRQQEEEERRKRERK